MAIPPPHPPGLPARQTNMYSSIDSYCCRMNGRRQCIQITHMHQTYHRIHPTTSDNICYVAFVAYHRSSCGLRGVSVRFPRSFRRPSRRFPLGFRHIQTAASVGRRIDSSIDGSVGHRRPFVCLASAASAEHASTLRASADQTFRHRHRHRASVIGSIGRPQTDASVIVGRPDLRTDASADRREGKRKPGENRPKTAWPSA